MHQDFGDVMVESTVKTVLATADEATRSNSYFYHGEGSSVAQMRIDYCGNIKQLGNASDFGNSIYL